MTAIACCCQMRQFIYRLQVGLNKFIMMNDESALEKKPVEPRARTKGTDSIFQSLLRYVSMIGICFWMGGFTFYSAVVIHVGHRVFESHREIGFLTQEVTIWLNRSGAIVLLILLISALYLL
ncbi:MAG: hypothetical protein JWM99_69 [Verrucomicrobiales bacterium]|nr:hypothetical protein [Verrucomicrobiales bacterium]